MNIFGQFNQTTVNLHPQQWGHSSAYSMGGSGRQDFTDSPTRDVPGPGMYATSFYDKHKSPKWNLKTTGQRDIFPGTKGPGPGNYDVKAVDTSKKISFAFKPFKKSADGKDKDKDKADSIPNFVATPGPGAYHSKFPHKPQAPSRSFGYKWSNKTYDEDIPGPGKYYRELSADSKGVPKIMKPYLEENTQRHELSDDDTKRKTFYSTPGPGAYSIPSFTAEKVKRPDRKQKDHLLDSKITRENFKKRGDGTPGPGQYTLPSVFKTEPSKGVKMKFRPTTKPDTSGVPGPGNYPLRTTLSTKSFSVGRSFRRPLNDMDRAIPGPGQYDPQLSTTAHTWKFGSSSRQSLVQNEAVPGPGTYFEKDKDEIQTDKPPVIDKGKVNTLELSRKEILPGPGAYYPTFNSVWNGSPTYRVGTSARDPSDERRSFPGPGQYNTTGYLAGPRFTFGVGLTKHAVKKALFEPGPGSYDLPHTIGAVPKYLLPNGPPKIHF